jgi:hypothetical protein
MRKQEKIKRILKKKPPGLEKKHFGRILYSIKKSKQDPSTIPESGGCQPRLQP